MGSVFRPCVTRPLPEGAKIIVRGGKPIAVWTDANGKRRQAPATGDRAKRPGIVERASTYTAQYRDGAGHVRRVSTGCKSRDAARNVLANLERRAEKVRAGVVTQAEASVADHADAPIANHVDAYLTELAGKRGKGARRSVSPVHVANVRFSLRLVVEECGFRRLRDLNREAVARWVGLQIAAPDVDVLDATGSVLVPGRLSPRTINTRLVALTAWGNWLVGSGRLVANPFARLEKLHDGDDVRQQRRALTADELRRLLTVARLRPVAQFGRPTLRAVNDGRPSKSRATWKRAELTFDTIAAAAEKGRARMRPEAAKQFDRVGRERALIYHVLVTTGLRRGELAAIRVRDVLLDERQPAIVIPGAAAKNGERASLSLRADVAAELRAWIDDKAEEVCRDRIGVAGAVGAIDDLSLFDVPEKLVRILDRDLAAAGIPKRDKRGRTVDVHALRGTLATHLFAAGVSPVEVMTVMRHSRLETTLKHYTDVALLDVAGAVEKFPAIMVSEAATLATGTGAVALGVALNAGQGGQKRTKPDQTATGGKASLAPVLPVFLAGNTGFPTMGDIGLEPMTPSLSS
jgi:integrase